MRVSLRACVHSAARRSAFNGLVAGAAIPPAVPTFIGNPTAPYFNHAALALSLLLVVAGCESLGARSSPDLSGDVFVRTTDGRTRPQGGIEVRLLDFRIQAEQSARAAKAEEVKRMKPIDVALAACQSVSFSVVKGCMWGHGYEWHGSQWNVQWKPSAEADETAVSGIVRDKLRVLDSELERDIERFTLKVTRTTINGHYHFARVPAGHYVLTAFYKSAVDDTGWFIDVNLERDTVQDLSNFNFSDPRFMK